MRIILNIDDDVLQAAKELAARRNATIGRVISDLARKSLTRTPRPAFRNGFRLLPSTGVLITAELIDSLAEDEL